MSKLLKSILTASLVVCMTVCLGLFAAACITPEDTDKYFTVTVVLPDDAKTPVKDAEVAICTMDGTTLACLPGVKTDENGVAKSNLSSPVDYSDATKFLVKIHNLPDGYIYADEDGKEYGSDEGIIVDTAVSGFSVTVTLTEDNKPSVNPVALALDTPTAVTTANGATFTATKAATYLFIVSNYETSWTLGEDTQTDNFVTLEMKANETVTLSIDEDCKVLVNDFDTVNSMDAPAAATVGTPVNFNVMLISTFDKSQRKQVTTWGLYERNYYLNFTSGEAGIYKVAYTSTFANDDVAAELTPLDSYTYPEMTDNNVFKDIVANEAYQVTLDPSYADYSSLNVGDVISYTVTIEYVGADEGDVGGGDEDSEAVTLSLGENNISEIVYGAPVTCNFNGTANATYTVTVTLAAGDWSLNGNTVMSQSTTVIADGNGLVTFELGYSGWDDDSGAFTLTLTANN